MPPFASDVIRIDSYNYSRQWDGGLTDKTQATYCIDLLLTGKFESNFSEVIFKVILVIGGWSLSHQNAIGPHWRKINIGSGNGLVPSGNKPLPGPILIEIYVAIWRHYAPMRQRMEYIGQSSVRFGWKLKIGSFQQNPV